MKASELHAMTVEQLHELAKKKGRSGNASWEAKQAQTELCRRNGWDVVGTGSAIHRRWNLSDEE